jgi:hypothetical protein
MSSLGRGRGKEGSSEHTVESAEASELEGHLESRVELMGVWKPRVLEVEGVHNEADFRLSKSYNSNSLSLHTIGRSPITDSVKTSALLKCLPNYLNQFLV